MPPRLPGACVVGFDGACWREHRFALVLRGSLAKFAQHPRLAECLRSTGSEILVEASPVDAIWAIGLAADDPRAHDPERWPGLNLLGFALVAVRERSGEST